MLHAFVNLAGAPEFLACAPAAELLREALHGMDAALHDLAGGDAPTVDGCPPGLEDLFPGHCSPPDAAPATSGRWPEACARALACLPPGRDVLVVSPLLGPVSAQLLRGFLLAARAVPQLPAAAAGLLHHNSHPVWLRPIPDEQDDGTLLIRDNQGDVDLKPCFARDAWPYLPGSSNVSCSQELIDLVHVHGSLALIPDSLRGGRLDPQQAVPVMLHTGQQPNLHVLLQYPGVAHG